MRRGLDVRGGGGINRRGNKNGVSMVAVKTRRRIGAIKNDGGNK